MLLSPNFQNKLNDDNDTGDALSVYCTSVEQLYGRNAVADKFHRLESLLESAQNNITMQMNIRKYGISDAILELCNTEGSMETLLGTTELPKITQDNRDQIQTVVLEGLGSALKSVWDALVKVWEWIKRNIRKFFGEHAIISKLRLDAQAAIRKIDFSKVDKGVTISLFREDIVDKLASVADNLEGMYKQFGTTNQLMQTMLTGRLDSIRNPVDGNDVRLLDTFIENFESIFVTDTVGNLNVTREVLESRIKKLETCYQVMFRGPDYEKAFWIEETRINARIQTLSPKITGNTLTPEEIAELERMQSGFLELKRLFSTFNICTNLLCAMYRNCIDLVEQIKRNVRTAAESKSIDGKLAIFIRYSEAIVDSLRNSPVLTPQSVLELYKMAIWIWAGPKLPDEIEECFEHHPRPPKSDYNVVVCKIDVPDYSVFLKSATPSEALQGFQQLGKAGVAVTLSDELPKEKIYKKAYDKP